MADGIKFTVDHNPDLAESIYDMPNGQAMPLLKRSGLGSPIQGIESSALSIIGIDTNFDRLFLTSTLEVDDNGNDLVTIAREAGRRLLEDDLTVVDIPQEQMGLGLVLFRDFGMEDVRGYIMPARGGDFWQVNSVLDSFRYDGEYDIHGVRAALQQHVLAIRALITVVSESSNERHAADRSHVFNLTMPPGFGEKDNDEVGEAKLGDGFNAFVGIDPIVGELRDMVKLANTSQERRDLLGIELTQTVLLYGPSGVAKSHLMRTLGSELEAEVRNITLSSLADSMVGSWAKAVEAVFESAYKSSGRVLIVLDEMDGLINTGNDGATGNITAVLKQQLEKIKLYPNVFVAAATNEIDKIDDAVKSDKRFPLKLPIGLPKPEQRADIFKKLLVNNQLEGLGLDSLDSPDDLALLADASKQNDSLDFAELAAKTDNFSGGDIREVIAYVNKRRMLECPDEDTPLRPITQADLMAAIMRTRLS